MVTKITLRPCGACEKSVSVNALYCPHCGDRPGVGDRAIGNPYFCEECGALISKMACVCPHCGVKPSLVGPRQQPGARQTCPECQFEISQNALLCPNCGYGNLTLPRTVSKKKKVSQPMVAGIYGLLVLGASVLLFYGPSHQPSSKILSTRVPEADSALSSSKTDPVTASSGLQNPVPPAAMASEVGNNIQPSSALSYPEALPRQSLRIPLDRPVSSLQLPSKTGSASRKEPVKSVNAQLDQFEAEIGQDLDRQTLENKGRVTPAPKPSMPVMVTSDSF